MNNIFKNPYLNSLFAEIYIALVVSAMHYFGKPNTPDTPFDGIAFISLFVLSASIMGFLFLGEPLQLYLSGEKKHAVSFFMKTVLTFAAITILALITVKVIHG